MELRRPSGLNIIRRPGAFIGGIRTNRRTASSNGHDARVALSLCENSSAAHQGGRQILDRRCAALLHRGARLEPQQFEHTFNAGLTERAEPP